MANKKSSRAIKSDIAITDLTGIVLTYKIEDGYNEEITITSDGKSVIFKINGRFETYFSVNQAQAIASALNKMAAKTQAD